MTNSRRTGSLKHYKSAKDNRVSWCSRREVCPIRCNISFVLYFSTKFFDESLQYNKIVLHRSALSAFHDPIQGINIGDHPRVSDPMSRVFNQSSQQPKYTFIWVVQVVLEYLRNLPENNLLLDKTVTLKVVFLLALTSASRA